MPPRINYSKIYEIKALLSSRNWFPQKKLGQNYLIDLSSREFIWHTLNPEIGEVIWEVGPGLGALTCKLVDRGEPFWVFELDKGYIDFLVETFGEERMNMVRGDFLKTWKIEYRRQKPDKILGNLPYNISSQIILKLIEGAEDLPFCVFTVQKELAERICARPGQKDYSSFSLLCQWAFEVKIVKFLGAGVFYPRPQVNSAVVTMTPIRRCRLEAFPIFHSLVKMAFSKRRKILKNNLTPLFRKKEISSERAREIFFSLGLSLSQRAEELTLEQYLLLASLLG